MTKAKPFEIVDLTKLTRGQKHQLRLNYIDMKKQARDNLVYFINTFCYTFNPKQEPYHLRFKLFPFQENLAMDFYNAIMNKEDLFVEKCREIGVTYVGMAVLIWFWLFEPASNFLIGSRKEDYVDNRRGGSAGNKEESLFGKIDYMLSRLPSFMLPLGYSPSRHFHFMSLVNPENGNVISGESANPNFSRGSRHRAVFLDEFAFFDFGSQIWGATADTTNCRIVVTTPGIKPSKAKRLRYGKDGEKIKVLTLRHNLDPRKTVKWLEEQKIRRSKEDFAREIMIDWEGSTAGRVYPEIDSAKIGKYPLISFEQVYCSWDFGLDGTALIFWQYNKENNKWRIINAYENNNQPIQFYFPLFGKPMDSKFQYNDDDLSAIKEIAGLPKSIHFGDPDVKKRSILTGTSTKQELATIGVYVQCQMKNDFYSRREKTKVALQNGVEINKNTRTEYCLECIKNSRYPIRDEESNSTSPIAKPVHNWTCLGGETRIRTLNGSFPIRNLVGRDFWVWSYSIKRKKLVSARAGRCWKSGRTRAMLVKLGYSFKNRQIRCTPEHRFMLEDMSYVEAQNLKVGDVLMSSYKHKNNMVSNKVSYVGKGYNKKDIDVFDIEVPKFHNFTAERVIVHNSHFRTSMEYHFVNVQKYLHKPKEPKWYAKKVWGKIKKRYK